MRPVPCAPRTCARCSGSPTAAALSKRVLARPWQMLFKGLPEVQSAAKPIAAAEMVLVRIAYAADLPTPDEVVRSLTSGEGAAPARPQGGGETSGPTARADAPREAPREAPRDTSRGAPRAALASAPQRQQPLVQEPTAQQTDAAPDVAAAPTLARFEDLIALAAERRDLQTKTALERDLRLVRFEPGRPEVGLEPNASKALVSELGRRIRQGTGQPR